MQFRPFYPIAFLAIALIACSSALGATTWTVTSTADDGSVGTLRWAITQSQSGDTINFNLPYPATIFLTNFDLVIGHSLTITGPGSGKLTIDSSQNHNGERVLSVTGGTVSISGLTVTHGGGKGSDSSTNAEGGAIYNSATLSLTDVTVSNSHVSAMGVGGGGIFSSGTLALTNCTVTGNQAGSTTMGTDQFGQPIVVRGGGIRNQNGSLTISNSTISNNFAHEGGGIWTNGTQFSVSGSTFSSNQAGVGVSTTLNLEGGGIYVRSSDGGASVINSTFANNQGKIYGGAMAINPGGSSPAVIVSDSTFSGNLANASGNAFSVDRNTLILKNNILSDGSECNLDGGTVSSLGSNLASDSSCALTSTGDQQNTAAGLDPSGLQNNGGSTRTIALLSNSPAVDNGSCTDANGNTVATDQVGTTRPQGTACDIGAFELVQSGTTTVTNTDDSGSGSLRDAIANAPDGGTIDFNLTYPATITLTSGVINIDKNLTVRGPGAANLAISGGNTEVCFTVNGNQFCTPPSGSQIFDIVAGATVSITGVTLENGNNDNGGALINNGTLTLGDCVVTANVSIQGAALNNQATGTLVVNNCTISGNTASGIGGGLINFGTATITDSTFSGNRALEAAGAYNGGTLTIVNSTFANNQGTSAEGAIGNASILHVSDTTFYDNSAGGAFFPSGLYTFSGGTATLKGTLLAKGALGDDCASVGGTIISLGSNLADDATCSPYFTDPTDKNDVSADLDSNGLQDNGGATKTVALLSNSAAVDAGPAGSCTDVDGNAVATDQRGVPRPQGVGCDAGAFELVQTATTTSVASSLNSSTYGQSVTFTATVQAASGTPTGTVTFYDGNSSLGTGTLVSGQATLSTAALTGGQHTITAVFGGGGGFTSSTSLPLTQTVNPAASSTSLNSSLSSSTYGQSVTFTATVSSTAGTPTGSVTFLDGANTLGTVALDNSGQATLSTSALTGGSHTIFANYSGDTNFQSSGTSNSQTVNRATPTITVTSSPNPSTYGQPITLTVTVSSTAGTPTGTVTFMSPLFNVIASTTLTSGQATMMINSLGAGSRSIYASYGGDTNFSNIVSSALTQTINKATTTTTLTSSPNPSTSGQSVALRAVVQTQYAVPLGNGAVTGSVTFMEGAQKILGTVSLFNGVAELDLTTLGVGPHTITATYNGDANNIGSTSSAVTQVVASPIATTTTLTSSLSTSYVGTAVTFTANVSPSAATGTVTFYAGQTAIGSSPLNGGQATFTTTTLLAGSLSIVAVYSGDSQYASSTSAKLSQTVLKASTTTLVAVGPNPSFGGSVTLAAHVQLGSPNGGISPAGTVTFMVGSTAIGSAPLNSNGIATLPRTFAIGKYNIKAVYNGSNACLGSTSSAVTLTVSF